MPRRISETMSAPNRVAAWIRKNYPKAAPEHGHCYLVALCGTTR